jgi:hypothetical protein
LGEARKGWQDARIHGAQRGKGTSPGQVRLPLLYVKVTVAQRPMQKRDVVSLDDTGEEMERTVCPPHARRDADVRPPSEAGRRSSEPCTRGKQPGLVAG